VAGEGWGSPVDIKLDLLKNGHAYSFFQVIRLLRMLCDGSKRPKDVETREQGRIRVRPDLSLAFPAADIAKVEETPPGDPPGFLVTATFLGLYGTSSPLPTFYTEDLLEEASEDRSTTREFIDVINGRLYELLFRCWGKYRLFQQVAEEGNPGEFEKLFCLVGLGEAGSRDDAPESYQLLRYAGLFSQVPRSALGLETLLRDALGGIPVEVVPCLGRNVKIPLDQRLFIGTSGCSLGEDGFLGESIDDRMGKLRLRIGPLPIERFRSLLPGHPDHERLAFLSRLYLADPLEYDIELLLLEEEARTACLGSPRWSRLGWDTWTFSGESLGEMNAVFPPHYGQEARIC
jgi:type VI secretion system protein ImpH